MDQNKHYVTVFLCKLMQIKISTNLHNIKEIVNVNENLPFPSNGLHFLGKFYYPKLFYHKRKYIFNNEIMLYILKHIIDLSL